MSSPYTISLACSWKDLEQLAPDWDDLLMRSAADTLFLRWDWLWSWAGLVQGQCSPYVLSLRQGGRLLAVAPLYRAHYRLAKGLTIRGLRPLGDLDTGAEYPDFIVDEGHEDEGHAALCKGLLARHRDWDMIWLPRVAAWNGAPDRMRQACQTTGLGIRTRPHSFSVLHLPPTFDEYAHMLPARRRRRRWHRRNRILRDEGVQITTCSRPEDVAPYLDALFRLHHRRWQLRSDDGCFRRRPLAKAFYRTFVPRALERGWLSLHALRQHDDFKAIQIGYRYGESFLSLQEGFDPDYLSGAGSTLRLAVIEQCIHQGIRTYDFLGEHTPHKASWLAHERLGADILITHHRPLSRLIDTAGIWPTGRYLVPCMLGSGDDWAENSTAMSATILPAV